ncbi:MAG TPA: chromosome segregation protein SMC, partial [Chthonomonadaceae bacterium]|nr:chromosome segregation protein SMC [Chthonomonadaceae bacterium]
MQLKKLQLLGFKTFADKTDIEIDSGLTAIVGPNGSGKSNVVDALLWVLGEQNPRMLRGNSAQDVIFSGTDKRKPLGMAEVRLTVDNADGALPIKFSEVTIARRIYRSGESQYLLNGAPCRLKDIVELFLDTGVGKGAYSVVSQTEIDAVLSARPEDRRELFEEAAGIKKYRVKKKEALRKLEAAEGNLTRVRDILNELEEQRGPMEQQAQAARRYLLLQERLHEIEVGLLVAELQKADYELYAGRQEQEDDQAALLRLDAELARLDRVANEVRERLALAEGELDAVRAAQQNALSQVERTESRLTLMTERGQTAEKSQERLAEELEEIAARTEQITAAIAAAGVEMEETEAEEAGRQEEWTAQKAALEALESAVTESMRQAEERQGERMRLAQERASREAALSAAHERLAEAQARAERLKTELSALLEALAEAQARRADLEQALQTQKAQRAQLAEARAEVEARQQAVQAEQVTARAALDSARRTLAEQSARLSTLTELQASHEGFYQGVKAMLTAHQKGQIKGHYRAVVDLLTVAEPYRIAIEVALGGSLQDIVTKTEAEAKAGIEWLKRNRAGRATFLPLPLLRPAPGLAAREVKGLPAVEGIASDLVEFDPEYAPMARLLLGRVLVVADMDAALALSHRVSGWSKIVTLQGELLTPGGALTGGSLQGRGAHLVGRKGEMDDLTAALPAARADVERLSSQVEANGRRQQELEAERAGLSRQEATAQAETAGTESAAAAAGREQHRLEQDRKEREATLAAVQAQIKTFFAEADRLAGALASDAAANLSADDALAALTEETRALAARRDGCRARAIALEVEVSRLQEKREGLRRALAADKDALAALELQHQHKSAQRAAAQTEGAEATEERERLIARSETARAHLAQVEKELAQWRDRRQALLTESFDTNNAIKETTQRRAEVTQQLHATELRLARLEVQIAQATERLQEEYAVSKEDALARPEDVSIDKNTA